MVNPRGVNAVWLTKTLFVLHCLLLYLMLLACRMFSSFLPLNFANAFCFHDLSWLTDT